MRNLALPLACGLALAAQGAPAPYFPKRVPGRARSGPPRAK
jgi:hypothetical protein